MLNVIYNIVFAMKLLVWLFLLLAGVGSVQAAGTRILFIGDSITDGNWGNSDGSAQPSSARNHWDMNHIYGSGYMYLCASYYQSYYPDCEYQFFNRGISGNTIYDLKSRWKEDAVSIHADIVSILIGTNDINSYLGSKSAEPFDFYSWEQAYRNLLDSLRCDNPQVKIVLGEPFTLCTGNMKKTEDFALRDSLIQRLGDITQRIADDYGAVFIPYASMFHRLFNDNPKLPDTYWIWDGIHPTPAGHRRMADLWMEKVGKYHILPSKDE